MDLYIAVLLCTALSSQCVAGYYTNTWAVQIEGDTETAKRLAEKHGFVLLDQVVKLPVCVFNLIFNGRLVNLRDSFSSTLS